MMHWVDQALAMRAKGYRVLQIAEVLGMPPSKVRDTMADADRAAEYKAIEAKFREYEAAHPPVIRPVRPASEISHAPAPLPENPRHAGQRARRIVERVAFEHGMTADDIKGRCRKKAFVAARRQACHELHKTLGWSSSRIGRLIGRDHSAVLNLLGALTRNKRREQPTEFAS